MSELGQSRHFDHAPVTSGLPRLSDILSMRRHVSKVPKPEVDVHSITSSAVASSAVGTARPSALATLRLITNSYFVGACTGSSLGFAPFRMRSTYVAARLKTSIVFGPYEARPPLEMLKRKAWIAGRRCCKASELINSSWADADAEAVAIRPPFGSPAKVSMARFNSPASRGSIALSSTADEAADWMAANWPIPAA